MVVLDVSVRAADRVTTITGWRGPYMPYPGVKGQLWFDTTTKKTYIHTGDGWRTVV